VLLYAASKTAANYTSVYRPGKQVGVGQHGCSLYDPQLRNVANDLLLQGFYAYDKFGEGLSFSANGSTLAVGAYVMI
jgi:hypothetical protein